MISKISVENKHLNNQYFTHPKSDKGNNSPSFRGGLWALTLQGLQECEKNPMINVAVVDMLSAILPRTIVESTTNWFAGFEAFRRESSGLIVNCLIPSVITWGAAAGLNKLIMPKNTKMASCWADHSLIERAAETYTKSSSKDKITETFTNIIGNIEGSHGKKQISFNKELTEKEIKGYAKKLKELSTSEIKNKELSKEVEKIAKEIAQKTHVYENVKVTNGKEVKANTVKTLLEDSVKFFKEFQKVEKEIPIEEFAQKSKSAGR